VLKEVGEAGVFEGVVDLADADGESGSRLVEINVGDKEDFEAVREGEAAELGFVGRCDDPRRELGQLGCGCG